VEQSSYSVLFWIGSEGTGPGLHWDSDKEQILYQCTGRKTVTCFSPEDVARLYPAGSFFHPHGHVSQIPDCSSVDHERFPRFVDAVPFECQLEPGDALYLPPFWIHDPSACGPSLSFTLRNVPGDGAWGQSSRAQVRTALQGLYNELRQLDPHLAGAYAAVAAHDLSTGLAMADTQSAESAAGAGSDD
jgi:hypothetical protein